MKRCTHAKVSTLFTLAFWGICLASPFQTGTIQSECGVGPRDNYLIYTPKSYTVDKKWPLIVFLHGSNERGRDLDLIKNFNPNPYLAQHVDMPFVVVSLQCAKGTGWENDQVMNAINYIMKTYSIDEDRVSVTGVSMGGFGTWAIIAEYPWVFSAAAPICGGADKSIARRVKDLPIWMFHGDKDPLVPIAPAETLYRELVKIGAKNVTFTRYPGMGHDVWDTTYTSPEIYQWLIAQKRPSQPLVDRIQLTNRFANPTPIAFVKNEPIRVQRWLYNPSWRPMKVNLAWTMNQNAFWHAAAIPASVTVAPRASDTVGMELTFAGDPRVRNSVLPLPSLSIQYVIGDSMLFEESAGVSMQFAAECRVTAPRARSAIKLDGDLSDKAWTSIKPETNFVDAHLEGNIRKQTEVRATWDAQNLYFAVRCFEDMDKTPPTPILKGRDADYWRDNAVEIFIGTKSDLKDYYHIVANSAGDFYDANQAYNRAWNGDITVKAGKEKDAWTLEISVPWKNVEIKKPEPGQTIRVNFVRDRIAGNIRESSQWSPTFGDNHRPEKFGTLELSK